MVVSASPATDAALAEIARWAAVFGKREIVDGWETFEDKALGRATLDTALGLRRASSEPVAAVRERFICDTVRQNCGRPELGCYWGPPTLCALSKGVKLDQPCDEQFACAPGLDCVRGATNPDAHVCKPYCDAKGARRRPRATSCAQGSTSCSRIATARLPKAPSAPHLEQSQLRISESRIEP